jgi:hypothetical protein
MEVDVKLARETSRVIWNFLHRPGQWFTGPRDYMRLNASLINYPGPGPVLNNHQDLDQLVYLGELLINLKHLTGDGFT